MHYRLKDAKTIYEQEGVLGKLLLSSDDIDYVHLTIEPHSSIPAHPLNVKIDFIYHPARAASQLMKRISRSLPVI